MEPVVLDGRSLTRADVVRVARGGAPATLAPAARERIAAGRRRVDALLAGADAGVHVGVTHRDAGGRVHREAGNGKPAYGVTTGFGELARVRIPHDKVEELQENLLLSHAAGVGEPLPRDVVRAMLLLRANALAVGLSGVRPVVVDHLLALLNADLVPVVPSRGSLGASGDLVPLAHMALVLTGRGHATLPDGRRVDGAEALAAAGLAPLRLQAKEGLALVNGTQMMSALLALALEDGWRCVRAAEVAGAMSVEALLGSERPFDPRVAAARPHPGHEAAADNLRRLLADSAIVESHRDCDRVQDAYSLRCLPQVMGAVRQALGHAEEVLARELNAATDNPLLFGEDGDVDVVSAGNFHGEPLALVALYVAAALAEAGAMSERRVARLVDPHLSGLPAFLATDPGLQSGLMIPQYVAAGLVMENRALCAPAATDSIPTSANQEDHVSNGAVQCLHLARIVANLQSVVGIELVTAAQAIDLRAPLGPGRGTRAAHAVVRRAVPHLAGDRLLAPDLAAAAALVRDGSLLDAVEAAVGPLR